MISQNFAIISGMVCSFFLGAVIMWTYIEVKQFKEAKKKNPIITYPKAFTTKS